MKYLFNFYTALVVGDLVYNFSHSWLLAGIAYAGIFVASEEIKSKEKRQQSKLS